MSLRFVSKIEGNAVEEGEKVFFEGIVDAQPMPSKKTKTFLWKFVIKKRKIILAHYKMKRSLMKHILWFSYFEFKVSLKSIFHKERVVFKCFPTAAKLLIYFYIFIQFQIQGNTSEYKWKKIKNWNLIYVIKSLYTKTQTHVNKYKFWASSKSFKFFERKSRVRLFCFDLSVQ